VKKWIPLIAFATLMPCSAAPALAQGASAMMGEHDMSGTVQKIDHKKGTFQLKTHEGVLHLHFPPSTVKDVKNGDALTVHLGFKMGASPAPMQMK